MRTNGGIFEMRQATLFVQGINSIGSVTDAGGFYFV
jgi:hypothetical protein